MEMPVLCLKNGGMHMTYLIVGKADNGMYVVSDGKHTARYMLSKRASIKEFAATFGIRRSDIIVKKTVSAA